MDASDRNLPSTEAGDWQRVSALSLVFFAAQMLRKVAQNFVQVGVPLFAFLATTGGFSQQRLVLIGIAIVVVIAIYAIANYLNTRFRLDAEGLVLRTGVFSRSQLNVEYHRIQALNLAQNPIYRWFKVVNVTLDTAGSAETEVTLPAVGDAVVQSLRERLANVERDESVDGGVAEINDSDTTQPLLALTAADMVRIGLSSKRTLVFLAVLGSVFGALESQDYTYRLYALLPGGWWENIDDLTLPGVIAVIGALLSAIVAVLLLLSIASAFYSYWGFRLVRRGASLVSRAGLVTVRTQTLPLAKAQTLSVTRGIVHGWLRRAELAVQQAGGNDHERSDEFVVPIIADGEIRDLTAPLLETRATSFLTRDASAAFHAIAPRYVWSRLRLYALLPAIAAWIALGFWANALWQWLLPLVWILAVTLIVMLRYRRWGYFCFDGGIAVRHGLFGQRVDAMLWRKTQFVKVKTTPFLARHELGHLQLATAGQRLTLPFVRLDLARQLAGKALQIAQTSRKSWI